MSKPDNAPYQVFTTKYFISILNISLLFINPLLKSWYKSVRAIIANKAINRKNQLYHILK